MACSSSVPSLLWMSWLWRCSCSASPSWMSGPLVGTRVHRTCPFGNHGSPYPKSRPLAAAWEFFFGGGGSSIAPVCKDDSSLQPPSTREQNAVVAKAIDMGGANRLRPHGVGRVSSTEPQLERQTSDVQTMLDALRLAGRGTSFIWHALWPKLSVAVTCRTCILSAKVHSRCDS